MELAAVAHCNMARPAVGCAVESASTAAAVWLSPCLLLLLLLLLRHLIGAAGLPAALQGAV
jgi:hypothetical protein